MATMTAEQICLLGMARTVWRRRAAAKKAGLPYDEETITQDLLLDLSISYPGEIEIIPFSKPEEGDFGADWLWSFVSADSSASLTMLVQAKKLDKTERRYSGLNQLVGDRSPPERQIASLLATAARHRVPAMYAFYNHLADAKRVPRVCRSLDHSDRDQILGFGISMAEADRVDHHLPDDLFDTHREHSIHLHCLLCTSGSGSKGPGGSAAAIAQTMRRWRRDRREERKAGSDDPPTGSWRGSIPSCRSPVRSAPTFPT